MSGVNLSIQRHLTSAFTVSDKKKMQFSTVYFGNNNLDCLLCRKSLGRKYFWRLTKQLPVISDVLMQYLTNAEQKEFDN